MSAIACSLTEADAKAIAESRPGEITFVPDEPDEDGERYRWFRNECEPERRIEIAEIAEVEGGHMLDHHIDKGRCGL